MRSMMPEALRLARCFSMALAEMPIFAARAAALNVPSSASGERFSPYFSAIGSEDASVRFLESMCVSEQKIIGFILFFARFALYSQLRNSYFGNGCFGTKIEAYEIF